MKALLGTITITGLTMGMTALSVIAADDAPLPQPIAGLPEGMMIIEGDIVVPIDFYDRQGATYLFQEWPNGSVSFQFDANVTPQNRQWMIEAMTIWESAANVDFFARNGESNYLYIQDAEFNASEGVGMQGGRHDIWIVNWDNQGILLHELAHALAYWHEQSRVDRETFIQIEWNNICQDCCDGPCDSQFEERTSGGEYAPYDFGSIMHYGQCAFSCCDRGNEPCETFSCPSNPGACRTITVLPPHNTQWQTEIGQRDSLSHWDRQVMSFIYPESDWRFADRTHTGNESGTFRLPFDTFDEGYADTPDDGTLWLLQPGTYTASATRLDQPRTIRAPLGARIDRAGTKVSPLAISEPAETLD